MYNKVIKPPSRAHFNLQNGNFPFNHFAFSLLRLVSIIAGIVLPSSELQHASSNIKNSNDVLLEGVTQDKQIVGSITSTIINTANANIVSIVVSTSVENHIERVSIKDCTTNLNTEHRWNSSTRNDVRALITAVHGSRHKSLVDSIGHLGREVVESSSRIDNVGRSRSAGNGFSVQIRGLDFDGVEIVCFGVSGDGCYEDGGAGEILHEIDGGDTTEGEVAGGAGDVALDDETEEGIDESLFVHGGEDGVVGYLGGTFVGRCAGGVLV